MNDHPPNDPLATWCQQIFERAKRETIEREHRLELKWPDTAAEAERIRAHALGVKL